MNPRLSHPTLRDLLPDPRRPRLLDVQARWQFFESAMGTQHTTLTVGNERTEIITEPMRIRSAQVGAVADGTVTVQVYADGRPLFDDSRRPVSGGAPMEATDLHIIPAGTVVTTTIEADSGVPTGSANVVIDTEPFVLAPRFDSVELTGRDRLRVSKRREAELANQGVSLIEGNLMGAMKDQRSRLARRQRGQLTGGLPFPPRVKRVVRGGNPGHLEEPGGKGW